MPSWDAILSELNQSAQEKENNGKPDFDGIRRRYLAELHAYTKRNVILYMTRFTNQDAPQPLVTIVDEDMTGLMTVIHGLKGKDLDLILHSPGGSLDAAESLLEYLRSKFSNIRVIVPHLALSAATMIACGANAVVMGKHSFLGPIDPQIMLPPRLGGIFVPAQEILAQFDKLSKECQDPKKLIAFAPMLEQYGPHLLVACETATKLSKTVVATWLRRWMFRTYKDRKNRADKLAGWLSSHSKFMSHGRHIQRSRLQRYGMVIEHLEEDAHLQDLVLSIFHATTHTFNGTGAAKIIENHVGKAFVKIYQVAQPVHFQKMPFPKMPIKSSGTPKSEAAV